MNLDLCPNPPTLTDTNPRPTTNTHTDTTTKGGTHTDTNTHTRDLLRLRLRLRLLLPYTGGYGHGRVRVYVQDINVKAGLSGYVDHVGSVKAGVPKDGGQVGVDVGRFELDVDEMVLDVDQIAKILCLCVRPKTAFPGLYRAFAVTMTTDTFTLRTLTTSTPALLGRFRISPGIKLTAPRHIIDNAGALRMRCVLHKY